MNHTATQHSSEPCTVLRAACRMLHPAAESCSKPSRQSGAAWTPSSPHSMPPQQQCRCVHAARDGAAVLWCDRWQPQQHHHCHHHHHHRNHVASTSHGFEILLCCVLERRVLAGAGWATTRQGRAWRLPHVPTKIPWQPRCGDAGRCLCWHCESNGTCRTPWHADVVLVAPHCCMSNLAWRPALVTAYVVAYT